MERTIKFRAWDKEHREWATCILGDLPDSPVAIIGMKTSGQWEAWQQFTGLKDKNGTEIYEGDILKGENHWSWGNWKKEVKYSDGCFFPFGTGDWEPNIEDVEIIGNKYENPDLLTP